MDNLAISGQHEGSNDEYYPLVAVAAVDICGMKQLIGKDDNCSSAIKALALLVKNASADTYFKDESLKNPEGKLYKFGVYFGDSVYLFADTRLAIGKQVDLLAVKCASLIAEGFHLGFLVRAGVAVGDLRGKVITLANGKGREVRIGGSMAKAYELQECKDWIGGAVESEFPPAPKEINRIKYDVPIREEADFSSSKPEAINWVYMLAGGINGNKKNRNEVINVVSNSMLEPDSLESKKTKSKLENTLRFIEYVFSKPEYMPYT